MEVSCLNLNQKSLSYDKTRQKGDMKNKQKKTEKIEIYLSIFSKRNFNFFEKEFPKKCIFLGK